MKDNMTIEEIATQVMAGILANPKVLDSFDDPTTIVENVTRASIRYAKELKDQLKKDFLNAEDAMIVE